MYDEDRKSSGPAFGSLYGLQASVQTLAFLVFFLQKFSLISYFLSGLSVPEIMSELGARPNEQRKAVHRDYSWVKI